MSLENNQSRAEGPEDAIVSTEAPSVGEQPACRTEWVIKLCSLLLIHDPLTAQWQPVSFWRRRGLRSKRWRDETRNWVTKTSSTEERWMCPLPETGFWCRCRCVCRLCSSTPEEMISRLVTSAARLQRGWSLLTVVQNIKAPACERTENTEKHSAE